MNRRGLILGLMAAPFVVRTPGLLMPVSVERPDPFIVLDLEGVGYDGRVWARRERIANASPNGVTRLITPYAAFPPGLITKADWVMRLPFNGAVFTQHGSGLQDGRPAQTEGYIRHVFEWVVET